MNIGYTSYTNALPLSANLNKGLPEAKIRYEIPSKLNRLINNNELDISIVSSIHYLKNKQTLKLIKPFCIAAQSCVDSVFLFYRPGFFESSKPIISLTHHSETSIALLKILCANYWKINPIFKEDEDECDAELIIGDKALFRQSKMPSKIDLATAWYKMTKLPFVFALCVAQKNVPTEFLDRFSIHQSLALESNLNQLESIVCENKGRFQISNSQKVVKYLSNLQYILTPNHIQSLELFDNLLTKAGLYNG